MVLLIFSTVSGTTELFRCIMQQYIIFKKTQSMGSFYLTPGSNIPTSF